MTTGAMAFGHGGGGHAGGGGFGSGGHAMAMGHSMAAPSAAVGGGNFRGGNPGRFARGYAYGGAALGLGLGLGALAYGADPYGYGYCGGYPGYYDYDTCSGYGW